MFDTLGAEGVSLDSVRETGRIFFAALYSQPSTLTMNEDSHRIYTRKKGKPIRIMALPPTDGNLDFHVMRAHLQMKNKVLQIWTSPSMVAFVIETTCLVQSTASVEVVQRFATIYHWLQLLSPTPLMNMKNMMMSYN